MNERQHSAGKALLFAFTALLLRSAASGNACMQRRPEQSVGMLRIPAVLRDRANPYRGVFSRAACALFRPSEKLSSAGPWPVVPFGSMFLIRAVFTAM